MEAKIIYFNWNKVFSEDEHNKLKSTESVSLGVRINCEGEFISSRPDLYDYVADFYVGSGHPPYIERCDEAFRKFNRVEEDDMEGLKIRSMSVGDAVLFPDGKLFVCQGMGWEEHSGKKFNFLSFWNLPKVEEQ